MNSARPLTLITEARSEEDENNGQFLFSQKTVPTGSSKFVVSRKVEERKIARKVVLGTNF